MDEGWHPILSCAEAKTLEAALLRSPEEEWAAMQQVGGAIACAILGDLREIGGIQSRARVLVLVGNGHNGGDAVIATRAILEAYPGATADVVLAFGEAALRPLARRALQETRERVGARLRELDARATNELFGKCYEICLDGVFGFQFRPPIDEATAKLIAHVNSHPNIRLRAAVDLPSGLGEQGAGTMFRADFTYATGIVKTPLLRDDAASYVGRVRYLDLGFFAPNRPSAREHFTAPRAGVLRPCLLQPISRLRPTQSDKRTFGHLFVVGGSRSYPGAILMTVQAALRSGVGLLTAFVPVSLAPKYAARFPEAMWMGCPETANGGLAAATLAEIQERMSRATAIVIGPGLSAEAECLALACAIVREAQIPLLLDADALRSDIVAAAAKKRLILTPHTGEWQRLNDGAEFRPVRGGQSAGDIVAVRKGYPTFLERCSGRSGSDVAIEPTIAYSFFGGPVLARGGSGDLLAGLIGGLLAQQPENLWLAAARGVVWHGLAADLLARAQGQVAVQTTQLLDYLHQALHAER